MSTLYSLLSACELDEATLPARTESVVTQQACWLTPVSEEHPTGDDPGYDDDFQRIQEEVNKISGADTELVCRLAEQLLTTTTKDLRLVTWYIWGRLQQEGEHGLADGLEMLGGMLQRFGGLLHPLRGRRRKMALEWLCSARVLDSLAGYPEVVKEEAQRIAAALWLVESALENEEEDARPTFSALYQSLEARLIRSGGVNATVPQSLAEATAPYSVGHTPELKAISSGQDLLAQARTLATYLNNQSGGWLSAHHLMKSIRHDTLSELPPLDDEGRTRVAPPKADQKALLKRLWLQQAWTSLLEQSDSIFSRGACHLWLDLQWYIHQALLKSGREEEAAIVLYDLKGLLLRLPGLESLAFNDGMPFADDVTLNWIRNSVLEPSSGWEKDPPSVQITSGHDDIFSLEPEAVALADSDGLDAALAWLQSRPGITSTRDRWLLRLLMARIAEQTGKNELALHLLGELDDGTEIVTLTLWEPGLLFEVKARRLKLLRMKAGRSEADKIRLNPEMEKLQAGLVAINPVQAAVLCG